MMVLKASVFLAIAALFHPGKTTAQNNVAYIDSINQYQKYVDSLVLDYTANIASNLRHASADYSCSGSGEMGAFGELYRNAKGEVIVITWQSNCDSLYEDKEYYFINNKIVLALDGALSEGKRERKYYKNDVLLLAGNQWVDNLTPRDEDLENAYRILKDFMRPWGNKKE